MKKLLAALLVATSAVSADATVYHYTLVNGTFTDGGSMSGSFDFDTVSNNFSNYSFSTTANGALAARTYTSANEEGRFFGSYYIGAYVSGGFWELVTDSYNNGGPVNLDSGGVVALSSQYTTIADSTGGRVFAAGAYLTTNPVSPADVPEPAMLGLFGLGAIGLGLSRRRKA